MLLKFDFTMIVTLQKPISSLAHVQCVASKLQGKCED